MKEYLDMVRFVLKNGIKQVNRTGVSTIGYFGYFYKVDLENGYPLLTTKKMNFKSILHELFWFLSGEADIKNLCRKTKIWNDWVDKDGKLETSYGRFWRRFPVPKISIDGENWGENWIHIDEETGDRVFDQIQFVIDALKDIKKNPSSKFLRRLVVSAWHPANAAESKLPPCHYTFCFNVKGEKLNCHLTQRSGDIALGIPFNLACYSLLTMMIAKETGFKVGKFAHTIIDAHIYENHIEGLKKQLNNKPKSLPKIQIADKPFNELIVDDIILIDYEHYEKIQYEVAI